MGNVSKLQGKFDKAVASYRRALELNQNYAEANYNLGLVYRELGKRSEAVACFHRALELKPEFAAAHNSLGGALKDGGNLDEAVACYRRALELKADCAEAHCNLGNALRDQGKLEESLACCRRALELKPDDAEAHRNMGMVLKGQGKLDDAVACYRRALELKPDYAEAHNNLGNALKDQGKLEDAVACYQRALALNPDSAGVHNNLGSALNDQGKLDEALACYRRALELKTDYAKAHSNLLMALQYCSGVTPSALAEAHAEYDRQHAARLKGTVCSSGFSRSPVSGFPPTMGTWCPGGTTSASRNRPLRVGFVSPDLGRHPVGYFLVRVLENLRQLSSLSGRGTMLRTVPGGDGSCEEQLDTICYSDLMIKDDLSRRIQAAVTHWRDVIGMSDQELAEQIRADVGIDILFDLAGHTAQNRLFVFARKPAADPGDPGPVCGHSPGPRTMNILIADRWGGSPRS